MNSINYSPNFLIAVTAYNCENQIKRVLSKISEVNSASSLRLVVIDNVSSDSTASTAEAFISSLQADNSSSFSRWSVLTNKSNYGLGGSHKVAFQIASDESLDGVLIIHGDDQANPIDFFLYMLNKPSSFFRQTHLGARFMSNSSLSGYPILRILGNHIFNTVYSMVTRRRIFDMGSGLNYFPLNIKSLVDVMPNDLTFNNALLLALSKAHINFNFFAISWNETDQVSNAKLLKQSLSLANYLIKYIFNRRIGSSKYVISF